MKIFSELKRRNVFRMAVLYVLAAWVVMQVAGVLVDLGVLPAAFGPRVLVVLVIGFPIALVCSWLFEITPEGLAREKDVAEGASIKHITGRRMDFIVIAMLSAGLILFAADKWWQRAPPERSIAVLPFENMSADPEQNYFSDGISEEILNLLAQIRPLKVIARTSSFSFKGKAVAIAAIAQQLNVRHILEGSVRRSGNRVRITAQLIDTKDSSHLWSQTFDRDYSAENLFTIQSEIARTITNRMRITLTGDEEKRLAKVPTENTEAYAAYLLGRDRLADPDLTATKAADAVEQFAQAIELDPQFAGAYSGLADACFLYEEHSEGQINEQCPSSAAGREQLARKALELDPESGEAWSSLGVSIWMQWRPSFENIKDKGLPAVREKLQEAMAAYERGVELSGDRAQGYQWAWYGFASRMVHVYPDPPSGFIKAWQSGRMQAVIDRGLEVDPLSIDLHRLKSWYPVATRSKEEAFRHAHRIIEIAPDSPRGYDRVGQLEWSLNGRFDEAIRWRSKELAMAPDNAGVPEWIAYHYTALGDLDMALAYFDLASALAGPDNQRHQQEILRVKILTLLTLGQYDAQQLVEMYPQLSDIESPVGNDWRLFVFLDLATGRPVDALARMEGDWCLGATEIPEPYTNCPVELVRIYQELGDDSAAQALGDAIVRRAKLWADGIPPADWMRLDYAAALATAGQTNAALDILEDLVASGWRGDNYNPYPGATLCCNVAFDAIRDDERFKAIVATFEADMAQQLENVREMQQRGEVPTLEEVKALIASTQEI